MIRRYWFVLLLLAVPAALAAFAFGCGSNANDDDDGGNGEPTPPIYDPTMIGFAFGNGVYDYNQGRWNKNDVAPTSNMIVGAIFVNRDFGLVYTPQQVYLYYNNGWIEETPPDFPAGAMMFDAARTADGTFWFAANDAENNGYFIRIGMDGSKQVIPMLGNVSFSPVRLTSAMAIPGDNNVYFTAEIDLNLYVVAWDGMQGTSFLPIIAQNPEAPIDVLDLAWGPDGAFWVAGYDWADGAQLGVIWHFVNNEWSRQPLTAASGCRTVSARRIYFTPQGTAYALAECSWSQIYHTNDLANWQEMPLPGEKGDEYKIRDLSLLDDTRGWAVGYTSSTDGPLLLLRDPNGWQVAVPQTFGEGDRLWAVAMFDLPAPGPDDDTTVDDDTVVDDDTTDDDAVDDDLVDDDTAGDES